VCGLRLVGPAAARLWSVDEDLHRLTLERQGLIDALRAEGSSRWPSSAAQPPNAQAWPPPPPSGASVVGGFSDEHRSWPEVGEPPVLPPFPGRRGAEFDGDRGSPPLQIQTVLLALGAFSLIVAAVVFIAVTWRGLSAPAKSGTLIGLTAVFAGITTLLHRRSLAATAEALAAVTVMLGGADAYAVRVGLFPRTDQFVFWGMACAVLALVAAGFARWSGADVARLASVVLIQLPAPLLAARHSTSQTLMLGVLLLQALVIVEVLGRRSEIGRLAPSILRGGGTLAWAVGAAGAGGIALSNSSQRCVAAGLLAAAGLVAMLVAWRWSDQVEVERVAASVATASGLAAAATLSARWLDGNALALTTVALAVVLGSIGARVDRRWTSGPVAVATLVAVGASAPSWLHLGVALRAPWWAGSQYGEWAVPAGRSARAVGVPDTIGSGFGPALGYLGLLAVGALGLRPRIGRATSNWSLAVLGCITASTLPLAVDASVWAATTILLITAVLITALALWRTERGDPSDELAPWWAMAGVVGGQGLAWAVLSPGLTLLALTTIAVTAATTVARGLRDPTSRVVHGAAVVMSVAIAAAVPVAARVVGMSPEAGWTALGVAAAAAFALCFPVWYRSVGDDADTVAAIAMIVGGITTVSYVGGALGAGVFIDRGGAPGMLAGVFAAGSASALFVAASSIRHRFVVVPGVAVATSSLLGLATVGTAAVQVGLDPAASWLAVLIAAAILTIIGMLVEVASLSGGVVGAVDGSAAAGAVVAVIGLATAGSADRVSVGLLVVTLALGVASTRESRRGAVWGAALGALVLLWQRLAIVGVTTVEAFTLPAAAFLASLGIWWHRREPDESSWTTWGPALVVALGPSVVLALGDPGVVRPVVAVVAAAVVTLVGARWQRRAPFAIGAAALVVLGVQQLGPFVRQLPRWVVFATVGTLLLVVGASYERRRAQFADLRSHYRRLH